MAKRRMFANSIVGSARFLRMPATARLLYYDLGMEADDDGFVEAFTVIRKTGANEDDLRVLAAKGFVRVVNEDLVSIIYDWKTNNLIKKDRYTPSIYRDILTKAENGTQVEPKWNQEGTQVEPQYSIGKDSIVQCSTGQGSAEGSDRESRINYLRQMLHLYQNKALCDPETQEQYQAELDSLLQEDIE